MPLIKDSIPSTTGNLLNLMENIWTKLQNIGFTSLGTQTINIVYNGTVNNNQRFKALKFPNFNAAILGSVDTSNNFIWWHFYISIKPNLTTNNFLDFVDHTTTPPTNTNGLNVNGFLLKVPNVNTLIPGVSYFNNRPYNLFYLIEPNKVIVIILDATNGNLDNYLSGYEWAYLTEFNGFRTMIMYLWKDASNKEYGLFINDLPSNIFSPRFNFYSFLFTVYDPNTTPPSKTYYYNYSPFDNSIKTYSNYSGSLIKNGILIGSSVSGSESILLSSEVKIWVPELTTTPISLSSPPAFLFTSTFGEITNGNVINIPGLGNYEFYKLKGNFYKGNIYIGINVV